MPAFLTNDRPTAAADFYIIRHAPMHCQYYLPLHTLYIAQQKSCGPSFGDISTKQESRHAFFARWQHGSIFNTHLDQPPRPLSGLSRVHDREKDIRLLCVFLPQQPRSPPFLRAAWPM